MSPSNLKKLIYQFEKNYKNIKIHNFKFELEYTRTHEHDPKSQDLKNTKFLGCWAFNIFPRKFHQTMKKFTFTKLMPKIFITTFSFHPKSEIFLCNKHTQTQKIINIFPKKSRFSFKPNTNRTSSPHQHLSLLLLFSPFSPQYDKNPPYTPPPPT